MKTIKEWQKITYDLAVEKGWHSRECDWPGCNKGNIYPVDEFPVPCHRCINGRIPVDPHSPTCIASRLALIHCEISEAVECVARGGHHMQLHWRDSTKAIIVPGCASYEEMRSSAEKRARLTEWKPEGFPIELADVFLRLCDLAESLGRTIEYDFNKRHSFEPLFTPEQISAALFFLHQRVGAGGIDPTEGYLTGILAKLNSISLGTGVDLLATAELKHEYNRTRPFRHGGKAL